MIVRIPKISLSTLFLIIPIYYFNSCTSEFIKNNYFVMPIVVALIAIWFLIMLAENRLNKLSKIKNILLMCIYAFVLFLFIILGKQDRASVLTSNFTNTLFLLFFMCVFIAYSGDDKKNDRRFIVFVWICDTVISCLYSIYRLIDEPYLSRYLSTGSFHQTSAAANAKGIISFAGVYGLVLAVFVLLYLLINDKEKRFRRAVFIGIFLGMIITAQFTLAILLIAIGVVVIIYTNNLSKDNMLVRGVTIIAITIPIIIILPFLLKSIANSGFFGYEVTHRINEIIAFIYGGKTAGSDLMSRFAQYSKSISVFFSSYGMGAVWFDSLKAGTHSEIFDGFANYGFLYSLFVVALFNFRKYILSIMKNNSAKHIYKIVFAMYILMSCLNTSTWAPMTLILFVIIPFICLNQVGEKTEM